MDITETTSLQPVVAGIVAMSGGRLGATLAALIGLVGAVIGGLALARRACRARAGADIGATGGPGRAGTAVGLGATAVVLGAVFLTTADGGLGSGDGVGGAFVAVALGLIAMILGGLARARGRDVA